MHRRQQCKCSLICSEPFMTIVCFTWIYFLINVNVQFYITSMTKQTVVLSVGLQVWCTWKRHWSSTKCYRQDQEVSFSIFNGLLSCRMWSPRMSWDRAASLDDTAKKIEHKLKIEWKYWQLCKHMIQHSCEHLQQLLLLNNSYKNKLYWIYFTKVFLKYLPISSTKKNKRKT